MTKAQGQARGKLRGWVSGRRRRFVVARRHPVKASHQRTGAVSLALLFALGCHDAPTSPGGTRGTGSETLGGGGLSSTSGTSGSSTSSTSSTSVGGDGGAPTGSGGTGGTGATSGGSTGGPTSSGISTSGGGSSSTGGTSTDVLADVTVRAGPLDRDHTITSFEYVEGAGQVLGLRDEQGTLLPVQVDGAGIATFILPTLAAGTEASFTLMPQTEAPVGEARATEIPGAVELSLDDYVVAEFRTSRQLPDGVDPSNVRAGYLHPVYAPGGTLVTDDFPIDPEGHPWHHGIWAAWTQTEFNGHVVDFWNSYKNEGRVDLDSVEALWQGPVHAGLDAKIVHVDLFGGAMTTALNERWVVRVYRLHAAPAPYFVFDLESTQSAASDARVDVLEWEYGGFALRGHAEWKNTANLTFLASDGVDRFDRTTGNGQGGRWCVMGGNVAGVPAAFGALGHPSNFGAPQKLRIHPSDPYMVFAPVRDGAFPIEPGAPYVTRLRFVTMAGLPDADLLDRLWNDYATPPEVIVIPR